MTSNAPLDRLSDAELSAVHDSVRTRYDAFRTRGLSLDLTRGKPADAQLDLSTDLLTLPGADDYRAADGTDCRNYGGLQGLPEIRALLAPLFGVSPEQTIVDGNSSLALMHDTLAYALLYGMHDSPRPWSREERVAVLCPVPGYDRHFTICQGFGIEMIPVELTDEGPDLDAVARLAGSDPAIKGMWCIPKYNNPTGTVYSDATIERLASMPTAAPDFRLLWDNAYAAHHLTDERVEIPSIVEACARHGHPHRAFVYGSTSKVTLAGAGVALVASSKDNVAWYLKRMSHRTIGADKINQLRHVRFFGDASGLLAQMDRHRAIIAPKFATVIDVFRKELDGTGVATWTEPKGGYFISLDVLDGCASEVVRLAREAGVVLTPAGSTFPYGKDPRDRNIRIAPTFPSAESVAAAAEGVALSVLLATTGQLLRTRGTTPDA